MLLHPICQLQQLLQVGACTYVHMQLLQLWRQLL
jgi:hypothetical protein